MLPEFYDNHAIVKNNIVTNIIAVDKNDKSFIDLLKSNNEIDFDVLLTEENFYNQINKAEIGTHVTDDGIFYPKSWIKNENNEYVPPILMPTDAVYRWREDIIDWEKIKELE